MYVREREREGERDWVRGNLSAHCNVRMLLETSQSQAAQPQIQRQDAEI